MGIYLPDWCCERGIGMNFRDELNKKVKPMKNEYDETRVEIEKEARRLYSSIKEILLLKAETGNYIYKHNMRYVSFYQFLSSRIRKLFFYSTKEIRKLSWHMLLSTLKDVNGEVEYEEWNLWLKNYLSATAGGTSTVHDG